MLIRCSTVENGYLDWLSEGTTRVNGRRSSVIKQRLGSSSNLVEIETIMEEPVFVSTARHAESACYVVVAVSRAGAR